MHSTPGIDHDPAVTSFTVLNVRVDAVQIPDAIDRIEWWIRNRSRCRYVAVTGMHGVTEAQHDYDLTRVLNAADLVVPDGMPLVWIGRLRGHRLRRRVYGPELMLSFCQATASKGYRHFLYGGSPEVCDRLSETLRQRFHGISIVGAYSPPFRPLTLDESSEIVDTINRAAPDVVWVGLSTPKQERWMHEYRSRLRVPVLVGVGAAFDINSGTKKQAPEWMREHGFEWLFRLIQEPRRLWRRYLVCGSQFVFLVAMEFLGVRRPDLSRSGGLPPRRSAAVTLTPSHPEIGGDTQQRLKKPSAIAEPRSRAS
ncbi:MAG: WecB/TagA/CpsF family glycosyltransferase [Candidatus Acidiferrales bacterium]